MHTPPDLPPEYVTANTESRLENSTGLLHLGSFHIAGQLYAADILKFREIICMQPLVKVPRANPPLEGIINLRDKVIPVISLHTLFGTPQVSFGPATRIVNLEVRGQIVGIIVDTIGKMYHVPLDQVEPLPAELALMQEAFVYGVCTVEQQMFVILNIDSIIPSHIIS